MRVSSLNEDRVIEMRSSLQRKILLVTNDLGPRPGGIETFILGLLRQLDKSSVVVYTSTQAGSEEFDQKLAEEFGALVIRDRSKVLLPTLRVKREVARVMQEYGASIIWFGAAMPLASMAGFLKSHGASRIVALTHGHEVWWAKLPIFSSILRRSSQSIDVMTFLGDFTKSAIIGSLAPSCRFIHIAPGIPLEHFSPAPKNQALIESLTLDGHRVLLTVGRLVHRKGQDQLIIALPRIIERHPDVLLLIVGEGPRARRLKKLVRNHRMGDYVRFVGKVPYSKLPDYFRLGDIFAMPSRSRFRGLEVEGLGIVYLEASATGLPVLAGSSGGSPDAVITGVTGVLVDGRHAEAIADAINKLLDDPIRMAEMGRSGRDWVEQVWGWNHWGERFREVLLSN
jgi:phosphatidylinositol alpha-1,6-mannosyltransferase